MSLQYHRAVRLLMAAVLVSLAAFPLGVTAQDDHTRLDLAYGPDTRQVLDLYLPAASSTPPPVLLLFGGDFTAGDKSDQALLAGRFAEAGYAVAAINTRLQPDYALDDQLNDAVCAWAWLTAQQAEYGIDAAQVAALGEAAGGTLAILLAVHNRPDHYLADCAAELPAGAALNGAVAYYPDAATEEILRALPADALVDSAAPILLVQGTQDAVVPLAATEALASAMQVAGLTVELVTYRADHGFLSRMGRAAARASLEEVDRFLAAAFGGTRVIADIAYIEDGSPSHLLDLHLPPEGTEGPYPVVYVVSAGRSRREFPEMTQHLVEVGYAAVAPEYGALALEDGRVSSLADTLCGLAWIYANADSYDLDSDHIVVFGYSGNAYTATMLGVVDDPAALMNESCPYDLPDGGDGLVDGVVTYAGFLLSPAFLHGPHQSTPAFLTAAVSGLTDEAVLAALPELDAIPAHEWRDATTLSADARQIAQWLPGYWLDGSEPPFLIIHGELDTYLDEDIALAWADALAAVGVEAEVIILPGVGEGLALYMGTYPDLDAAVDAFLAAVFES